MKFKEVLNRFWKLFWKDDSLFGWIFSLIIIILFIKLIFFPLLYLISGTTLPLAIVESCSMYHSGIIPDFNSWYENHESKYSALGIDKNEFKNFKMRNGFNKGDILFITGVNSDKIKIGDIIIFNAKQTNPIIHRVIDIKEENGTKIFSTYGDNNNGQLSFEKEIKENQIIGKASIKIIPFIGWGKLIFFELLKSPEQRGFCKEN